MNLPNLKQKRINRLLQSKDPRQHGKALESIVKMKANVLRRVRSSVGESSWVSRYGDDAFIRACHSLFKCAQSKGFELRTPNAFENYLFTACRGELLKMLNKDRFMTYLDTNKIPETPTTIDDYRRGEIEASVLEEVSNSLDTVISKKERQILINKYYWRMSYKEIADEMDTTPNTVKTSAWRALRKLKKEFDENEALKSYVYGLLGKGLEFA